MDSITLITPEFWQDCGAQAFDDGLPITAHNMNPGAPAIKDFEAGWHRQRVLHAQGRQLEAACPP